MQKLKNDVDYSFSIDCIDRYGFIDFSRILDLTRPDFFFSPFAIIDPSHVID